MYGTGDVIRELTEDNLKLKREVKDKENYIESMEYALAYVLDWYWNIEEPGNVPDKDELMGILRFINKITKTKRKDK